MTASLLAIDLGTTRIKFGALDDDGTYRLVHSADAQTVFPEPGDDILVLPSGALSAGGGRRLVFCGVDVAHRRGHLYRAILEGLACEYAMMAEDLAAAGVPMRAPVIAMGGGTASRLLTRLKANVTGLPWRRVDADQLEFTLVGANLFVSRALGWGVTVELPPGETINPEADAPGHYRKLLQRYRPARRTLLASSEGT